MHSKCICSYIFIYYKNVIIKSNNSLDGHILETIRPLKTESSFIIIESIYKNYDPCIIILDLIFSHLPMSEDYGREF